MGRSFSRKCISGPIKKFPQIYQKKWLKNGTELLGVSLKEIVSRDWKGLQIILMDRFEV
jgi:hypothetical protein